MSTHEITDAELIRYLDGELLGTDRSELDTRLAAAPAAARRLAVLRQRSARLSSLIGAADANDLETQRSARSTRAAVEQAMNRRPRVLRLSPALQAAALITLLLGFGLAVPPVRAWMIEQVLQLVEAMSGSRAETLQPGEAPPADVPPQAAPLAIQLTVTSDTFTVQVAGAAGQLVVQRDTIDQAQAEPSTLGGANLVFMRNGLRIEGGSAATVHALRLPEHVRVLVLRRAGRVEVHPLAGPGSGPPLTLHLAGNEIHMVR
ncbi:MAG: hypothetical protein ACRERX_20745 [Pseudomonas sp.]